MAQQSIGGMNRRGFLAGGAALLGTSVAGCLGRGYSQRTQESVTIERSFAAPSIDSIRVENRIGDVTVAAVGSGDVGVKVLKRSTRGSVGLEAIDVSIELDDGILSVVTSINDDFSRVRRDAGFSDVRIVVPVGAAGPLINSVVSEIGNVTLVDTRGDTVARTRIGDVTATGVQGFLTLRSELGRVLAGNVSGLDSAYTELGDIMVDLLSLRGDVDIGTTVGDIVVGVAEHLNFDLSVETAANIDSNLTLNEQRLMAGQLSGRQNDGGTRLTVTSDLGEVLLRAISAQV